MFLDDNLRPGMSSNQISYSVEKLGVSPSYSVVSINVSLSTGEDQNQNLEVHGGSANPTKAVSLDTAQWGADFFDDLAYVKLIRHPTLGVRNMIFRDRD